MACHLTAQPKIMQPDRNDSLARSLLGDSRHAIGQYFYSQADLYFHRGVPHISKIALHHDPFKVIQSQVSPRQHVHLTGPSDIVEIMPWLDLSTRVDPQNLNSYLVAAFWLANEANQPKLAFDVLNRAQCNMPYAYRIQLAKGRLLLQEGAFEKAKQAFSAAFFFWQRSGDSNDIDQLLDKAEALLYRALLREADGAISGAISDLRTVVMIPPDRPATEKRLTQLEKGEPTEPSAQNLLQSLLRDDDARYRSCSKCEEDHDCSQHN
jgi:tetratricopeptide (TPR) repeat protein